MISPELAAKVLDADLRNIVKKVSDGGILSASERAMLQNAAFPEGQVKAKRALALALKYSGGARLSASELAEIREMHPGFAPQAEASNDVSEETNTQEPSGPALKLTPEPSPAAGDARLTREQLERWSKMYGTEHRQLRRWIERGKQRGDPCPLDNPAAMPAWIDKHLDKVRGSMRDKVQAAADAAKPAEPVQVPAANAPAEAPPPPPVSAPLVAPLDLANVGGVEGESVEFFRRIFAAVKLQLEEAYKGGTEDRIRTLHSRLEKCGESLRKHEIAAEARARRLGEYLDKAEVLNEVTQALNTLVLLREHRVARVRAELSDLPTETLERIEAVLHDVGRREEDVLRNLSTIKQPADVQLTLAA